METEVRMNILVTGGIGFIGHNVVRFLEEKGHNVIIIDNTTTYDTIPLSELGYLLEQRLEQIKTPHIHNNDLNQTSILRWLIPKYNIDTIIHLASFPRQKLVNMNPGYASQTMSEGLLRLLEVAKKLHIKRFVYISSSMVYGDFENNVKEDAVCNPQGQYGIMKLAGEWLVKDYSRRKCFEHTIIRPSAVYGPRDVMDRVVSKFIFSALNNEVLRVNGAKELLDFTYVDDVALGIVNAALSANTCNKTYNISRGQSRTLLEAANLVTNIVGKGLVEVSERDSTFPSRGTLNIDAAKNDFGYDPKIDIENGFRQYAHWLSNSTFWSKTAV